MENVAGAGAQFALSTSVVSGAIKDTTGAQLISKTLDKLNSSRTSAGPAVNADYQFQKDVLNAAGIGNKLDTVA